MSRLPGTNEFTGGNQPEIPPRPIEMHPDNYRGLLNLLGPESLALLDPDYADGAVVWGVSLCKIEVPTPDDYIPCKRAEIIADDKARLKFFELAEGVYSPEMGLRSDVSDHEQALFYQKVCMHIAWGGRTGGYSSQTVASWFGVESDDVEKAIQEVDGWLDTPELLDSTYGELLSKHYPVLQSYQGVIKRPTPHIMANVLMVAGGGASLITAELEGITDLRSGLLTEEGYPVAEYRKIGALDLSSQTPEQQIVLSRIYDLLAARRLDPGQQVLF